MNTNEHELDELVRTVVGAAYQVSNSLGCGFLEKVYERALAVELTARKISVETQVSFDVLYRESLVGTYTADLVVSDRLIVELKCVTEFTNDHIAQCLNYLKASGLHLALLFNFQHPKVSWKRVIRS